MNMQLTRPLDVALLTLNRAAAAAHSRAELSIFDDLPSAWTTRAAMLEAVNDVAGDRPGQGEASAVEVRMWDVVEDAEQFILDHQPTTLWDAAAILDVILDAAPTRSDARDHDALQRIRAFLLAQTDAARPTTTSCLVPGESAAR